MSTLSPAAKAAPSAVVSVILGLTTGIERMSDWNSISGLLFVSPPSTRSCLSFIPESSSIASKMSLAWKAVASRTALQMWALVT